MIINMNVDIKFGISLPTPPHAGAAADGARGAWGGVGWGEINIHIDININIDIRITIDIHIKIHINSDIDMTWILLVVLLVGCR